MNGTVRYDEGVHVGYRAWLRSGTAPAYPFGYGLGYTTWTVDRATATTEVGPGGAVEVRAEVTNTGGRAGKHVVQVYASRAHTAVDRPARWLVGHQAVRLDPGATETVEIAVPARAFAHWDECAAHTAAARGRRMSTVGVAVFAGRSPSRSSRLRVTRLRRAWGGIWKSSYRANVPADTGPTLSDEVATAPTRCPRRRAG